MKEIPQSVTAYKKTPVFTEESVPDGLLKEHRTKEGVWGKIVIMRGSLLYTIGEEENVLDVDHFGVVEPVITHQVRPLGKVNFYVEFYR